MGSERFRTSVCFFSFEREDAKLRGCWPGMFRRRECARCLRRGVFCQSTPMPGLLIMKGDA